MAPREDGQEKKWSSFRVTLRFFCVAGGLCPRFILPTESPSSLFLKSRALRTRRRLSSLIAWRSCVPNFLSLRETKEKNSFSSSLSR